MLSTILLNPQELSKQIALLAQAKRLSFNISQQSLAERSGVSYGSIKKFERTGKISLESLLKIALVLNCLEDFTNLFKPTPPEQAKTLDELIKQKSRKRGRK